MQAQEEAREQTDQQLAEEKRSREAQEARCRDASGEVWLGVPKKEKKVGRTPNFQDTSCKHLNHVAFSTPE